MASALASAFGLSALASPLASALPSPLPSQNNDKLNNVINEIKKTPLWIKLSEFVKKDKEKLELDNKELKQKSILFDEKQIFEKEDKIIQLKKYSENREIGHLSS